MGRTGPGKPPSFTITIKGYDGKLASLEDGLLIINLHKAIAGITIKDLETLYVDIPNSGISSASIRSDAGNISVEQVKIKDLSINSEIGDITVTGISGRINAVSSVGRIKTDLPCASKIMAGKDNLGNTLKCDIEGENKDSNNTSIYTNTGKILLQ